MVLASELLKLRPDLALTVFLHLASLFVLVIYFWQDIKILFRAVWQRSKVSERRYIGFLLATTLVTAVVAVALKPWIEKFENLQALPWLFLITAIFVGSTYWRRPSHSLGWTMAVTLGLVQGLAVLPGVSRSGLMIATALFYGLSDREAFRYAFLAGIPAIAGAFLITVDELHWQWLYLVGFAVTAVVSFGALRLLEYIIIKKKFYLFAVYTAVLAMVIFLL